MAAIRKNKKSDNKYTLTIEISKGSALAIANALQLHGKISAIALEKWEEICRAWEALTPEERQNVPSLRDPIK